jgi:Amt family ammonium transporter
VFGIHCVGGIIGAIATGILVSPALGGVGLTDYTIKPGAGSPGDYVMATQVMIQVKAVLYTLVWSGVGSAILYKIVDLIVGLRVPIDAEREGLDVAEHGERAYNM